MKAVNSTVRFLVITALLISTLMCYGQNDPSDLLVGTWTKSLNGRSVTFTISADQKYQVEFAGDDETDVWGSYVISGTQITFNDEGGQYSADEAGVYEFKVSDTSIVFTTVLDPVYGRNLLVAGSWSRASDDEK